MSTDEFPRMPALTGDALRQAIACAPPVPPFLVTDLLPEDASIMFCSDGAVGKSTLTLSAAAAMSAGAAVWGHFMPVRPLRVFLVLGERTAQEPLQRLRRMQGTVPIDFGNFFLSDAFAGTCNLLLQSDVVALIRYMRSAAESLDVVFLDPIYSLLAGAISDDRTGNLLTRHLTQIKRAFACALWFCHHNVKLRVDTEGKSVRAANPFFGSVWLFNHVSGQFLVERGAGDHVLITQKKDNWGVLPKSLDLEWDPETMSCVVDVGGPGRRASDRIEAFLRERERDGATFTLADVLSSLHVSAAQYYRVVATPPWIGRTERVSLDTRRAIYRVK